MKKFLVLIVLLVVFLVFTLAAYCESDAVTEESIFRVTQTIMPKWDPAVGSDYSSCIVLINVFDSLVFPTPDGSVKPWVAESWKVSEDGLTWDFKIREDIYFHSGNQLTANDVAYSMNRLMEIGEGFAFLFYEYIESVEVIDDFNVRFNSTMPYGPLLNSLIRFYIVDQALLETKYATSGDYGDKGDYGKTYLLENDAGSGPYIVDSVSTNISVGGSKFDSYWAGFKENNPEKFIVYASNEGVTVKTMMIRQELESTDMWQATENVASMLASDDTLKVAYNYTGGGINLWMNNQRAPMDDKYMRECFGYLIDYKTVTEHIAPGSMQKKSVIPSNLLGFVPVFDFEFNLEKAKEALAKSKYADTIDDMKIELIWVSETPAREKLALMIQAAAAQIDLNIDIVELPWASIVANSANMEMSPMMSLVSITPVSSDSGSQFISMFRSKKVGTWQNMNWVNDPVLDELIDNAVTIVDIDERAAAYAEIQEYCGENFTFVPIAETPERLVYQSSYVELEPKIGLQGFSFYLRDILVYPERRR